MAIFRIKSGFLLPILHCDEQGQEREADGKDYLDSQQAAHAFGVSPETVDELYRDFLAELSPDRASDVKVMELTDEYRQKLLRLKYSYLPTEYYDLLRAECDRRGLSLWGNQVLPELRWDAVRRCRQLTIIVKIDGARSLAMRTGEHDGRLGPQWSGEDGIWRDMWVQKGPPAVARVGIRRKGISKVCWGKANFSSYAQYITDAGKLVLGDYWAKMPETMLAKVAEMVALRAAFPEKLDGIYSADEMGQSHQPTWDRSTPQSVGPRAVDYSRGAIVAVEVGDGRTFEPDPDFVAAEQRA